jgi:hypothetical protein
MIAVCCLGQSVDPQNNNVDAIAQQVVGKPAAIRIDSAR